MTRRDDTHVRPDHHIISDIESAKIIESAILIYEDIAPDSNIESTDRVEGWNQQEAVVHLLADEIAEHGPDFIRVVIRQTVEPRSDRHRSLDVCRHGRRFRRSPVNYPGAIFSRHSLLPWSASNGRSAHDDRAEDREV